jgi:F0F1-type ATP synthase membrane subunit c/vacuolar-type H+-ATPase subunit K
MREKTKIVELAGKQYRIEKLDPLTCSYIATKLMARLAPVMVGMASGNVTDQGVQIMAVAEGLGSLTRTEMAEIQIEALSVCKTVSEMNSIPIYSPIRTPDGRWTEPDLEDDPLTVMTLVAHAVLFNITPFFDGNALKAAGATFTGLLPFGAKP